MESAYWWTHPDDAKLGANNLDVEPVDVDRDRPHHWDRYAAIVHVGDLHLEGGERRPNVAVLGQRVGAVAHEVVILAVEGVVEVSHHPAGAWGWSYEGWSSTAQSWKWTRKLYCKITILIVHIQ